jgi:ATP-dependent DNA helicase RecQ
MENETDYFNDLANNVFGIKYIYPYQRLVISNILTSASPDADIDPVSRQIVILPTGYGKSLCYMLPAVILKKPTIVLSPLLSLIKDQSRRLESAGISFSVLAGFLGKEEKLESIKNIRTGKSKILLTNPESLSLFWILSNLRKILIAMILLHQHPCPHQHQYPHQLPRLYHL